MRQVHGWEVCGLVMGIRKIHSGQCTTMEGEKTPDIEILN